MRRALLVAALALATAAIAAPPSHAAKRSVPKGFYGAIWAGPIEDQPGPTRARAWDLLALAGAESVRAVFNWEQAQPQKGGPVNWSRMDAVVAEAARRGISLMPTVMYAPNWAKRYPNVTPSPPAGPKPYAAFLGQAVRRYGPKGTFWSANPGLPQRAVRHWQIWNEPDLTDHWHRTAKWLPKEAKRYGALVRASYRAVRKADPGGRIVLAGLSNFAWESMAGLLKHGGVRGHFHIAAVHMFPGKYRNVKVIVRRFRAALDRGGARGRRIWVTEMTWPASKGRASVPPWADTPYYRSFITTEKGAASRLKGAYRLLADRRFRSANRLERVHWFSAVTTFRDDVIWNYTGLLELSNMRETPAYAAFRTSARKHEGCVKTAAGRCR